MSAAAAWIAVVGASAPLPASDAAAIDTAVLACERWLLDPASWSHDIAAFGRADGLQPQASVPDVALPPAALRVALHHWRIPIRDNGVYVTASDRVPMCHLSGGGPFDLQPSVIALTQSPGWKTRWHPVGATRDGEMRSRRFVHAGMPELTMTLSYAAAAGGRTDRVQLLATLQYQPGK